ncbi:MAG: zinc ABC transporter substrate-binding protein, partial [Anaerotignum sp.]|nr:zinc ABC transporter substrate-binding protein [Anaerotignum sp.]
GETAEEHAAHTHEHDHEGNPHIWLSPERAAYQAEAMAAALGELDAAEAELFAANAKKFHEAAHELQEKAHHLGIPEGEYSAVFHEGFAYFAELFHMENVFGIFADEYQMPSAKELAEATDEARGHGIRFFLTAADNGKIYAETIAAEVDETIVLLDPLTTADEENLSYLERMEKNIEAIEKHWKEETE